MAASQLSYLLTNQLASDDALSAPGSLHASLALSIVQTGQLIRQTEAEARSPTSEAEKATSVLHRCDSRGQLRSHILLRICQLMPCYRNPYA